MQDKNLIFAGLDIATSSPRVPSPWDDLIRGSTPSTTSTSPTPSSLELSSSSLETSDTELSRQIPRLAPEVEEGNVEYKLKLLEPTPARFARLVTQLKWRLLEGEGQCYYEIGVADSGLLIGLTQQELDRSLETLEEMAGEIGASVFVVKEVEVPDALVQMAQKTVQRLSRKGVLDGLDVDEDCAVSESWSSGLGAWDRRSTRGDVLTSLDYIGTPDGGSGGREPPVVSGSDLSATVTLPTTYTALDQDLAFFDAAFEQGLSERESPDELALFSFDPEPLIHTSEAAIPLFNGEISLKVPSYTNASVPDHLSDLSIAAVFKPRPSRRRVHAHHSNGTRFDKRQAKWEKQRAVAEGKVLAKTLPPPIVGVEGPTKAEKRRVARDKRREEKRLALVNAAESAQQTQFFSNAESTTASNKTDHDTTELIAGLEDLHVGMATPFSAIHGDLSCAFTDSDGENASETEHDVSSKSSPTREPRLIVEALVVRKLSAEEAYGPGNFGFEGFGVAE